MASQSAGSQDGSYDQAMADDRLAPCPATPNCVCSENPGGNIKPLPYPNKDRDAAAARLESILTEMPRTGDIRREGDFWYTSQKTLLFRFVDDLSFRFDDYYDVVQVRSASRKGKWDLGANRRRVEKLRKKWLAANEPQGAKASKNKKKK